MAQTDIYFVETRTAEKSDLLCRWVEHFYEAGKRVQVTADSTMGAQNLDQLLWTFSQGSFIPHRIFTRGAPDPILNEVIITVGEVPLKGFEVLISDGAVRLEFMRLYRAALHFVLLDDAEQRQESRMLWQGARDEGIKLHHVPSASRGKLPDLPA